MTKEHAILVLDSLSTWLGYERPITEEIVEAIKTLSQPSIPSNHEEVTESYVSFEIAKFLKEKGFDGECDLFGRTDEPEPIIREAAKIAYEQEIDDECVIIPTLQMAMKWLEEKYGIFCVIRRHCNKDDGFTYSWNCEGKSGLSVGNGGGFKTAEEACEACIKYCLENLI